jgi:hypothetical protein
VLRLQTPSIVTATLTVGYKTGGSTSDVTSRVQITPHGGDTETQNITQGGNAGGQFENGLQLVLPAGTHLLQGSIRSAAASISQLSMRLDIQILALVAHTAYPAASYCAAPAVAQAATFVMDFQGEGPSIGTPSAAYLPHAGSSDTAGNIQIAAPYLLRLTAPSLVSARLFADAIFVATADPAVTVYDVINATITITRRSDGEEFSQTITATAPSTSNSGQYTTVSTGNQITLGAGTYEVQGELAFGTPTPTPDASDVVVINARLNVFALPLHSE